MYEKGLGVPQDYETALKWYTLAAEQGNAGVQSAQGVPQDYKTALKWYTLAAEQGVAQSQSNLGVMEHKVFLQNYVYAHMWGNIAASNGTHNGGKLRDFVAKKMTPTQIAEGRETLPVICVAKNYKGC